MRKVNPQVLVLEEDTHDRKLISDALASGGIGVEATDDGLAALDMLEAKHFDAIVADVQLSRGLNGLETVRCAKAAHPTLRSLFVSGRGEPVLDDPESDDFVSKPFRARELLGCIWELLTRQLPPQRRSAPRRMAARLIAATKAAYLRKTRATA